MVCCALAALLAVLATVQYKWSTRVAAADAQREREHLDSAASLFANEFNDLGSKAVEFLQTDAWNAVKSGRPLGNVPKLIAELYYLETSDERQPKLLRLAATGLFAPTPQPEWLPSQSCAARTNTTPLAIVSPVYDIEAMHKAAESSVRIVSSFRLQPSRCFIARLNDRYLRDEAFPQMIRRSFGESAVADYNFAVVSRTNPGVPLYGSPVNPDLRRFFFTPAMIHIRPTVPPKPVSDHQTKTIFVQRFESTTVLRADASPYANLFTDGIWELDVAHRGVPLAVAFEQVRRRNLLLSLGVEALLLAAIVFLVVSVRRMQRLAEQKMQFVAAVSHELRTPVSAISMLSRNQADGLVAGADRVRQYGELIHQESRRLNDMVEQTLQYAGIHSGLRRRANVQVDLRALIQEVVDARRDELVRRGFEVEVKVSPSLPPVPGDANLLRTAFDNLLSNAEKYAGGGHWIRVRAEHSAENKEVTISVEDRGPGIDPSDRSEIFEPFARGQAAIDAQIPGSGLGLSLVRSAAEAHHGTVTLESEPGHGSVFTMHLPL